MHWKLDEFAVGNFDALKITLQPPTLDLRYFHYFGSHIFNFSHNTIMVNLIKLIFSSFFYHLNLTHIKE